MDDRSEVMGWTQAEGGFSSFLVIVGALLWKIIKNWVETIARFRFWIPESITVYFVTEPNNICETETELMHILLLMYIYELRKYVNVCMSFNFY